MYQNQSLRTWLLKKRRMRKSSRSVSPMTARSMTKRKIITSGRRAPKWRSAGATGSAGLILHEVAPFGDVKQSGLGREGSHYGIEGFL